jgi:hypothetical protein
MFPIVIPVINIILLQHSARGREPCAQPHDTQPRRSSLSLSGVHPSSTPGPPPSHVSRRNYTRSEIRIIVHRCRHASLARGSSYRVEERAAITDISAMYLSQILCRKVLYGYRMGDRYGSARHTRASPRKISAILRCQDAHSLSRSLAFPASSAARSAAVFVAFSVPSGSRR